MSAVNGEAGPLRRVLQEARDPGVSMSDLTVLAAQNDPYRVDTPAGHREGQWFAEQFRRAGRSRIHLRGLHYAIVARGDVLKPNGKPFVNSEADWLWLQSFAAKSGRWLGYVPFDAIIDQRNEPPVIHRKAREVPTASVEVDADIFLPDADDLQPRIRVNGFEGRQPYNVVIFGEKASLGEVLLPIAQRFQADLYLPSGEISDTLVYQMACDGAADGRPMRVFTLSDCDPSGWQMPVSIGRKLQAFRDLRFHDLHFEVRPVALTVDQVRELNLPSTPLKDTERRADKWRDAFEIDQTEIDALATLKPRVLDQIVRNSLAPFYDKTLEGRVSEAKMDWRAAAQEVLDEQIDATMRDEMVAAATVKLAEVKEQISALAIAADSVIGLPEFVIPEAETDPALHGKPLVSADWSWVEQTRALKAHKSYSDGDGGSP
jgi:hypothetical protein